MKRVFGYFLLTIVILVALAGAVSAAQDVTSCNLRASLVNQDPYPAIPGDYVKVVFQVDGAGNPLCGKVGIRLIQDYPFSLDPDVSALTESAGGSAKDFSSYLIAPYRVRVDKDAIDGETMIKVEVSSDSTATKIQEFNISIRDLKTDFEVTVKDYTSATNKIVFEILNIGKHNVEALTVDIPKQDNILVKGSNRNIVGSLNSNEDTTAEFEATPSEGEITISISYTDEIGSRRTMEKKVLFESENFMGRAQDRQQGLSTSFYVLMIVVLGIVGWWVWKRHKKRKEKMHHQMHHHSLDKKGNAF